MRIAPPSLPPHHSGPATRDFQSSILVEALEHSVETSAKLFSKLKLVTDNLLSMQQPTEKTLKDCLSVLVLF